MLEPQNFADVTIYCHQPFSLQGMGYARPILGYSRIEALRVEVRIEKYAQFERAVAVEFIPRGKRATRRYVETNRVTTVLLKGSGHPDVPHVIGEGPQLLLDEKWHVEFAQFLDTYRRDSGAIVMLDLRGHDTGGSLQIKAALPGTATHPTNVFEAEESMSALEGQFLVRQHLVRERDRTIVRAKREQVLRSTGKLQCEVCGFDFKRTYGIEFCEVHHCQPLGISSGLVETKLEDLAIVCSNCHRVIHRGSPFFTIAELRALLEERRG